MRNFSKFSIEKISVFILYSIEYNYHMSTPLNDILRKRGLRIADASRVSGIPYVTIAQHVRGTRGISAVQAIKYERLLGIPRSELRPDLWPPDPTAGPSSSAKAAL